MRERRTFFGCAFGLRVGSEVWLPGPKGGGMWRVLHIGRGHGRGRTARYQFLRGWRTACDPRQITAVKAMFETGRGYVWE